MLFSAWTSLCAQVSLVVGAQEFFVSSNASESTAQFAFRFETTCAPVSLLRALNTCPQAPSVFRLFGTLALAETASFFCLQGIPESEGSGYYGAPGEFCQQCPKGAICTTKPINEPLAVFGWWKKYESTMVLNSTNGTSPNPRCPADQVAKRTTCPVMLPCEPPESCLGNNTVSARDL
jgi:hypothetical protein